MRLRKWLVATARTFEGPIWLWLSMLAFFVANIVLYGMGVSRGQADGFDLFALIVNIVMIFPGSLIVGVKLHDRAKKGRRGTEKPHA